MATAMTLARAPWGIGWRLAAPALAATDPATPTHPDLASPVDGQMPDPSGGAASGPLPLRTRIGAAVRGLGAALDPYGGGLESFLSGATTGYTGTTDALQSARLAPLLFQRQQQEQALGDDLTRARIGYYNRLGQPEAQTVPDKWVLVNDPGVPPYRLNLTTGDRVPVAGAPTRPTSAEAPLTEHELATERRGVRSDRSKLASDLRLQANDVLNSPMYKGLGLGDLTTAADSATYTGATAMRDHAAWLASHPLTVPQVDSVRAGTLDYDNFPGAAAGAPVARTAPSAGGLPALTPAQVARAASDPLYKQFLQSKGYGVQ